MQRFLFVVVQTSKECFIHLLSRLSNLLQFHVPNGCQFHNVTSSVEWISLSFKPKEAHNGSQGAPMQRGRFDDDLDDSVPFASCDPDLEWRVG